jgi:hypothetical protein
MNPSVRRIAPFIVALFVSSTFAANNFDPKQFSTGNFHNCPQTGQGGDPYLNSLKNRDKPPTTSMTVYSVNRLYQVTPTLPKSRKLRSKSWTPQQRALAAKWECRPVVVEGYLVHPPQPEGQEACNCKSDAYFDHHMWLGPTANASRKLAMVVEISPRAWPNHPTWKNATATLKPVVDHKEKVRVAGWLTWDEDHPEQIGKTRRTLWEVHPIHSIQVQRSGQWVSL